ncbi:hypothetical protein F2Q69_00000009 [Brassica cretica]|uniref:Uncharacterized protein n=1 Tax=Brassica cretica TaxID=69181 RepID=A0A8S9PLV5_BRACR|nr:hypothetical protein F2Q69_00000009 [Brassica cretica]
MNGLKLPGVWKTLVDAVNPVKGSSSNGQNYRMLWTGLGAQLARDVPFSAICWSILEPGGGIIGANFTAGFVAGAVTGAATCPLDVAKTRRQIEVKVTFSAGFRQQKHLNKANIWHSSS